MSNVAQQKMNEIVAKVIENIENNKTGVWSKGWIDLGMPQNFKTSTYYSGFNTISLMLSAEENKFTSNKWLTFNQIKSIKNATLKKGSKSTPVFFFKMLDIEEEQEDGTKKEKRIPLLKFYNVFNLNQVEGINEDLQEKAENQDLNSFVANCNVEIKESLTAAYYSPKKDYIGMPDFKLFKTTEDYAATLLHELSHSTGHESRLNRDMTGDFGSESYSFEECVAELSSMFLMSHLNIIGQTKNSEAYIKDWLIKGLKAEPKMLWKIAAKANESFRFLVEMQEIKQKAA